MEQPRAFLFGRGRGDGSNSHRTRPEKSARKHGGGLQRVDLDQVDIALDTDDDLLLLLNDALEIFGPFAGRISDCIVEANI